MQLTDPSEQTADVLFALEKALGEAGDDIVTQTRLQAVGLAVRQAHRDLAGEQDCARHLLSAMHMADQTCKWCQVEVPNAALHRVTARVARKLRDIYMGQGTVAEEGFEVTCRQ